MEQEPIVIWFEDKWYSKARHSRYWSIGYDLTQWLVGVLFDTSMIQINVLCFWIQVDTDA